MFHSKIGACFLILFLAAPPVLFSQQYTRKQLAGSYAGASGGVAMGWQQNKEVIGLPPTSYHNLHLKAWGRFVLTERYTGQFDSPSEGRVKYRGKWKAEGDSLVLIYSYPNKTRKAYHIQFLYAEKGGLSKKYKFRLTGKETALTKVWKGELP